jgi:hypothetical protein
VSDVNTKVADQFDTCVPDALQFLREGYTLEQLKDTMPQDIANTQPVTLEDVGPDWVPKQTSMQRGKYDSSSRPAKVRKT